MSNPLDFLDETAHVSDRQQVPLARAKPVRADGLPSPTVKACPECGESILAVAMKCKHCHTSLRRVERKVNGLHYIWGGSLGMYIGETVGARIVEPFFFQYENLQAATKATNYASAIGALVGAAVFVGLVRYFLLRAPR